MDDGTSDSGSSDGASPGRTDPAGTGGVPGRDRHRHSIYMTGVLARALTARIEDMARPGDDTGWWFARPAALPGHEHRDDGR